MLSFMKLPVIISAILLLPLAAIHASTQDLTASIMKDLEGHEMKGISDYNFIVGENLSGGRQYLYRVTRQGPRQTRNLLLSVNGRPSGDKEIRDFTLERDTYSDDPDAPMKNGDMNRWIYINRTDSLIVPGSLVVKDTIGDQSYCVFKMKTPVGDSAPVEIDGMLVYNSTEGMVNTIELSSNKVIESKSNGKIESFKLRITYVKDKRHNLNVPRDLSWAVTGRKGIFSKFKDSYAATYSDYKIGDEQ
jgi:hypothetical protein